MFSFASKVNSDKTRQYHRTTNSCKVWNVLGWRGFKVACYVTHRIHRLKSTPPLFLFPSISSSEPTLVCCQWILSSPRLAIIHTCTMLYWVPLENWWQRTTSSALRSRSRTSRSCTKWQRWRKSWNRWTARVEATPTCVCSLEPRPLLCQPQTGSWASRRLACLVQQDLHAAQKHGRFCSPLWAERRSIFWKWSMKEYIRRSEERKRPDGDLQFWNIGRSQSFSTREEVEKEIKQCGVSVKSLKANYEIHSQSKYEDDKTNRIYKRTRSLPAVSECSYPSEPILEDELLFSLSDSLSQAEMCRR